MGAGKGIPMNQDKLYAYNKPIRLRSMLIPEPIGLRSISIPVETYEKMKAGQDLIDLVNLLVKRGASSEDIGDMVKKQVASWVVQKL